MFCPKCDKRAKVDETRAVTGTKWIRRSYRCDCGERFSTVEVYKADYDELSVWKTIRIELKRLLN